jgi:SAM-dependent methyltransferase
MMYESNVPQSGRSLRQPYGVTIMSIADYRKSALAVALDPSHSLHLLPNVPPEAHRILDVGCHAGHILEALKLPDNCQVYGCDIQAEALDLARQYVPYATFVLGEAEALPFEDSFFDFVFARSVIYTADIPKALREFNRVLEPGGKLWVSLHRWKDCRTILQGNWHAHPVKTVGLGIYAAINGVLFHSLGKVVLYPLNRARMMSFQTETAMRRELGKAGFGAIQFTRGNYLVAEATKLSPILKT